MPKVEHTAMLLGATGNVGRRILSLLVQSPLCKTTVVVTRRHVAGLADPKVQQVVVNMDTLEEELAPHAKAEQARADIRRIAASTQDATNAVARVLDRELGLS
jgi:N-acetyl-gamma-glutamylphosphate reductase